MYWFENLLVETPLAVAMAGKQALKAAAAVDTLQCKADMPCTQTCRCMMCSGIIWSWVSPTRTLAQSHQQWLSLMMILILIHSLNPNNIWVASTQLNAWLQVDLRMSNTFHVLCTDLHFGDDGRARVQSRLRIMETDAPPRCPVQEGWSAPQALLWGCGAAALGPQDLAPPQGCSC